ncbi:hypothetical protein [Hyalangium versicolor]|uniref:hypothetical protein n=1 Tax=Hyalangium versicolor TaxID=2861190 RepID=UPI001CCDAADB|nr:hypothetical protein [Hyalangium versicolor]
MARRSFRFLALLLFASSAVLAKGNPALKSSVSPDAPADLQLIGWSKDEKRFAVRIYSLTDNESDDLNEPPPYCPGYMDHRGKKFRGGLRFQLYDGAKPVGDWPIQDLEKCTPPETARDRLSQANTALAQQEVDLRNLGTLVVPRKPARPLPRGKGKTLISTATTPLVLPSGPWARQTVTVSCRVETTALGTSENAPAGTYSSRATFTVRLRSSKKPAPLAEFTLGPFEGSATQAGNWTPTVDRLVLSPSGRRFVLLGRVDEGPQHGGSALSVVLGLVELPEPPAPKPGF